MRILACNSFYYLRGGSESYFFDLSNLLASHGYEVIPFAMMHEKNISSPYSSYFIPHIDYPSLIYGKTDLRTKWKIFERVLYFREAKRKAERLLFEVNPRLAHVHGIGHEMSPSILDAMKRYDLPVVQTLHDYGLLCPNSDFLSNGETCERCKRRRYYQMFLHRCKKNSFSASLMASLEKYFHSLIRIYERNVDVFIAPSLFLKNKLAEYGFRGRVVHIPNFIDGTSVEARYEPSRYFVYAGRLIGIKGVETLVEAMTYVRSAELLIAGEGNLGEPLQRKVREKGLANVKFLGHLSKSDLIPLLQGAAFTVFPSECYENYPMIILESFSCGKPVVASNLGAIPELVQDGINGLLFEPKSAPDLADKIQYLLDHPPAARDMGRNGRRKIEEENRPETHFERIEDVYRELLS